jgi:hypothetical protein
MLTVSREDVKRKTRLGSEYDAEIDTLIAEMLPVIEYAIDPLYLESPEPGLLATLNLGALELIAGEMLATLWREVSALVGFRFGWLQVFPPQELDRVDPSGLKTQGLRRLAPYLKRNARLQFIVRPLSDGEDDSP